VENFDGMEKKPVKSQRKHYKCQAGLSFLNFLEECRDWSLIEWNFKALLGDKLILLLKQHKAYWKQRGIVKWVTLGDASTKFFHAHATARYRRNLITQLYGESGQVFLSALEKGTSDLVGF